MKNFFDYCNGNDNKTTASQNNINDSKNYENIINEYSSYSKESLTSKLFDEVNKKKQSGDFDIDQIKQAVSGARGLLTPEQNATLDSLLNKMS